MAENEHISERQHIWGEWSDFDGDNEYNDDDEEVLVVERRQYKMMARINMDKWDDVDFVYRLRLTKATVAKVFEMIRSSLEFKGEERCDLCCEMMCARYLCNVKFYICSRPRYIKPIVQLLIALRFYALGSIQLAIADFAGVSISSVCRILRRVSEAIGRMAPQFIRMPANGLEMLEAAKEFYNIVKFPRVIGAIDCTHVRIQSCQVVSMPKIIETGKDGFP